METVRGIATYVEETRGRVVSDEEREGACRSVLDLVAAAAAGITAPGPRAVRGVARATMAGGKMPIWFSGQTAGLAGAIWCNASAAAALDLDDGHRIARGHPGAAFLRQYRDVVGLRRRRGARILETYPAGATGTRLRHRCGERAEPASRRC